MRLTMILNCTRKLPKDFSNFPESYIKRSKRQIEWQTPKGPQYMRRTVERRVFHYGLHRSWTEDFWRDNMPGKVIAPQVVPPIDWKIFRGDRVEILVGKDKGKHGIVNMVIKECNWVTVEGLNCSYRTTGFENNKQMYLHEDPLLVNGQVALVDPSTERATEVEWRYREDGTKVRVSKSTGRLIPLPNLAFETYDYVTKSTYIDKKKDTPAKALERITFVPKLATFNMDIAEEYGIKDDRMPGKTWWY